MKGLCTYSILRYHFCCFHEFIFILAKDKTVRAMAFCDETWEQNIRMSSASHMRHGEHPAI